MNKNRPNYRLRCLIEGALADRLTSDELAEFEELLRTDDKAVEWFVKSCQLETALTFEIRAAAASRRTEDAVSALQLQSSADAVESPKQGKRPAAFLYLAASILLMLCFSVLYTAETEIFAKREPQPVARLVSTDQAEWLDSGYQPGYQFVENESIYLTKGSARLSLASGVEIELRGPCFVSLDDAMHIQLEEGVLTAQVAEWAHGFKVRTSDLDVVDLGTKFAVAANQRGKTETHVLEGQVRVHPLSEDEQNRRGLLLLSGEALSVHGKNKTTTKMAADRELYDVDLGDIAPYKPIPIFNTGQYLTPGDEDMHWRVVAGPNCPQYQGEQYGVVGKADRRYLPNSPDHSQWISLMNPLRPGLPENTTFTFQTTFELKGYDLSSLIVSAQVIADNGVNAVRLNGVEVPFEAWNLNDDLQVFNHFKVIDITGDFKTGINAIEFDVRNGVDRSEASPNNPMSLRVEWNAFGRPSSIPVIQTKPATQLTEQLSI